MQVGGGSFLAWTRAGDPMRNTVVRAGREKGKEGRKEGGGAVWMEEVWVQVHFSLIACVGARA